MIVNRRCSPSSKVIYRNKVCSDYAILHNIVSRQFVSQFRSSIRSIRNTGIYSRVYFSRSFGHTYRLDRRYSLCYFCEF